VRLTSRLSENPAPGITKQLQGENCAADKPFEWESCPRHYQAIAGWELCGWQAVWVRILPPALRIKRVRTSLVTTCVSENPAPGIESFSATRFSEFFTLLFALSGVW